MSATAPVLWLGGMSGVGKTTTARSLARRFDLRLYSLDTRTYEHAAQMPAETRSFDELWVDSTPEELADRFEEDARRRFPLVLADLDALPHDVPVLVEGPQVLPELVDGVFVVARPALQRQLVAKRGSDLYARTKDPRRALENRLQRDAILAERLRSAGASLVEIDSVEETLLAVEARFRAHLRPAGPGAPVRRREENDLRLRQVRAHVDATGGDPRRKIELECECEAPGCARVHVLPLSDAEAARLALRALVGH